MFACSYVRVNIVVESIDFSFTRIVLLNPLLIFNDIKGAKIIKGVNEVKKTMVEILSGAEKVKTV